MNPVFLDTVGLIAVWDDSDQWHPLAAPVFRRLLADRRMLVTIPQVLLECGNAAARRSYREDVCLLRERLYATGNLLVPTPAEEEAAWQAYTEGKAGDAGIVDHLSFAVMRRHGIRQAFTNDRHFVSAGFEVLF
jgi:predicted nucleic acid-binding protein